MMHPAQTKVPQNWPILHLNVTYYIFKHEFHIFFLCELTHKAVFHEPWQSLNRPKLTTVSQHLKLCTKLNVTLSALQG